MFKTYCDFCNKDTTKKENRQVIFESGDNDFCDIAYDNLCIPCYNKAKKVVEGLKK